ncbi:MAG TPA: PAS domain-containing protein, partial [Rectinemataceae bacterium]|nr:PAS domain-containing protein [Rectinemataceae bacterium]
MKKAASPPEDRFALLAANSPDTIYLLDLPSHRLLFLNRDEFLGYSRDELESGDSILSNLHPDDRERVRSQWIDLVDGRAGQTGDLDYRLRRKDGRWSWLRCRQSIIARDGKGKPVQLLVTLTDIDAQARRERRSAHQNRVLKAMASGLSLPAVLELIGRGVEEEEASGHCVIL